MSIKLKGSSDGSVSFDAPADTSPSGSDITLTLPTSAGSADQFLKNSGIAGELEYSSMVETSTGLGIGTTSPDSLLTLDASSNPTINIKTGGTKRASLIADTGNNYALLGSFDGYPLVFSASAGGGTAERARIDTSGRFLVGTDSAHNDTDLVEFEAAGANTSQDILVINGGRTGFSGTNDANTAQGIRFKACAFDTTNSVQELDTARIKFQKTGSWNTEGAPGAVNGKLIFEVASGTTASTTLTERMRITSDGTYKLGSTTNATVISGSPEYRLAIGEANASSSHDSGCVQVRSVGTTNKVSFISNVVYNNHFRFYWRQNFAGSITSPNGASVAYNTSSDYRLKENVVDLADGITRVKQLQPRRFNFIADADTTVDGFVAHEAQAVVPEAVTGTHNGVEVWEEGEELPDGVSVGDNKLDENGSTIPDYQGIDQSKLVPLLTAALQEAIAKIETLETKVAALEAA